METMWAFGNRYHHQVTMKLEKRETNIYFWNIRAASSLRYLRQLEDKNDVMTEIEQKCNI